MKETIENALEKALIEFERVAEVEEGDWLIMGAKQKPTPEVMGFGGYGGKSLIEKIQDEIDVSFECFDKYVNESGEHAALPQESYVKGLCMALGILRSSSQREEWNLAQERYNG